MKKILIIDDEDYILILFKKIIEKHTDYQVQTTSDINQISDLIEADKFDLFLLDINLPGTNGIEILQIIRHSQFNAQVPVVMISAMFFDEVKQKAKELGANDFITKIEVFDDPKREKLIKVVKKYLN